MAGEKTFKKKCHRMLPEIRRHVADAQPALGIAIIAAGGDVPCHRLRMNPRPSGMFRKNLLFIKLGQIVEIHHKIAACSGIRGFEIQCGPKSGDRLIKLTHILQGRTKIIVGLRVVRIEFDRPAIRSNGFKKLPPLGIGRPQIAVGHCGIRITFERATVRGGRFIKPPQFPICFTEVRVKRRRVRHQGNRFADHLHGDLILSHLVRDDSQ